MGWPRSAACAVQQRAPGTRVRRSRVPQNEHALNLWLPAEIRNLGADVRRSGFGVRINGAIAAIGPDSVDPRVSLHGPSAEDLRSVAARSPMASPLASPRLATRARWSVPAPVVTSLLLSLALSLSCVTAQQRITVGGPGADFGDLPEAVDVALDGDMILVEPGRFSGTTVTRGVRILGAPGTVLRTALEFRGVPADTFAAAAGLTIEAPLLVDHCRGSVLLEDCSGAGLPFHESPPIEVRYSSHVVVAGVWGFGHLEMTGSTVSLGRASFAGRVALPTVVVEGGFLQVTHSDLLGANSSSTSNPVGRFPPAPAVFVDRGVLALDGRSSLQAGRNLGDNDYVVPALFGTDSVLLLDPHCRLVGTRSIPVVGIGLQAFVRPLPGLDLGNFPPFPGALSLIKVSAPVGSPVLLFAGRPAAPVSLGSVGIWMLDSGLSLPIASGIASAVPGRYAGLLVAPIPVPALPEVRGFSILLQSVAWTDAGLVCGVPAPFVVR